MMKSYVEGVDISITTRRNALPISKPVVGWFRLSPQRDSASFVEDDAARVIFGEPKSHCVFRGRKCSVWWHPVKKEYKISVRLSPLESPCEPEWAFEECMNRIKQFIANGDHI